MTDNDLILASKIIRRKAKRISRAKNALLMLRCDIEMSSIDEQKKEYFLRIIDECISPYLENDDKEENRYNYDNANPKMY